MADYSFDWVRYWYKSDERAIFNDGFLFLPEGAVRVLLRNYQVEYLTLDALKEVPCLIMLGERGMGKSTALAKFVQRQMENDSDLAVHVFKNLRDYSFSTELREHVFEDGDLTAWLGRQHRLYFYLDSLDEGQLRIETITQLLQRQLEKYRHHIDRLYLRVVCRTLDWSTDFEGQLRRLWGDRAVQSFTLAPLRKENVMEAVAAHGLNTTDFFEEVYRKDAAPLAANPLDLFLLLDYYQQNNLRLPDTRREVYERGCLNRCRETNPAHRQRDQLSELQRRVVAGRVAACSVFTNRPNIHISEVVVRDPGEASLLVTEVVGDTEIADGVPFPVDVAAVHETLETQLFHGGTLRHWAHRKYETFLAAWYVTQIRQMPTPQLQNLLFDPSGKLIPQLAETAAWIADYDIEVFEQIVDSDPHVLMQGDLLALNDRIRFRLVEQLLQQAEQGAVHLFTNNQLQYLCHPALASQLDLYLDDPKLPLDARHLAIDIAESCQVTEVQDSLEHIALDSSESEGIRLSAIYALASLGNNDNRGKLRDLALLPYADSDNIELKEAALSIGWPDYITASELFASLDIPEANQDIDAPLLGTSMPSFILHWMKREHLPTALQWAVQLPKSPMRLPMALEEIAKGVFALAWENLEDQVVRDAFAQAVLMLASKDELYFLLETHTYALPQTKSVSELLGEDDTKRRLLLIALVLFMPDDRNLVSALRYHPAFYKDEDLVWLIERFTQSHDARERSLLAKMIDSCCIWSQQSEETALLFDAIRGNGELAVALGADFVSSLQGLHEQQEGAKGGSQPAATPDGHRKVQALPAQPNGHNAFPASSEERRAEIASVDPVIVDEIKSYLKKCEGGEYNEWVNISARMSRDKPVRPNPYYITKTSIESLPAWDAFDTPAHERMIAAAQSFMENHDPRKLDWHDDPFNRSQEPMAGYRAFRLMLSSHPDRLEVISTETWQRWAEILTFYGHFSLKFSWPSDQNDEMAIVTLLKLAYKFAPDEVLDTLDWIIANRGGSENSVRAASNRAKAIWDDRVAERLMAQLPALAPKGKSHLLESLLRHNYEPAVVYVHSLLNPPLPSDLEAYEHIVQATCELLKHDAEENWGIVWGMVEHDKRFGGAIIEMLLERGSANGVWLAKRLDNSALQDFSVWLLQQYPTNEDPPRRGIYTITLRHAIADFRDGILRELSERGDIASVQAIAAQFHDQDLSHELETARLWHRQVSWTPLKPKEFLEMMRNRELRQIARGGQLLDLLEELLRKLSRQLQGRDQAQATAESLWAYSKEGQRRKWYPKDEPFLSNFVAGFIQREAPNLAIGREVEVNAPSENRTDISVHAFRLLPDRTRGDAITTVIEVKGSWHRDVQAAMQTQLVDDYLMPNSWQHGFYLVGWFACPRWDSDDRASRDEGKLGDDFEDAQKLLLNQAQRISQQTGLDVRAFVLDARLQ